MDAYDQPELSFFTPSENTVAIRIDSNGNITSEQVISYVREDNEISGFISLAGYRDIDRIGIFATRGLFNIRKSGEYILYESIDEFIEYLENIIPINMDGPIKSSFIECEKNFKLLEIITGMKYDKKKFRDVQKAWKKHVDS